LRRKTSASPAPRLHFAFPGSDDACHCRQVGSHMQTIQENRIQTPEAPAPRSGQLYHHFTVDVEEYFQVSALEPHVPRSRWESIESRIDVGMDRLLGLLERHDARGTFFVLGWLAERR